MKQRRYKKEEIVRESDKKKYTFFIIIENIESSKNRAVYHNMEKQEQSDCTDYLERYIIVNCHRYKFPIGQQYHSVCKEEFL